MSAHCSKDKGAWRVHRRCQGAETAAAFLDAGLIDAPIARLKKYHNDSAMASLFMSALLKLMTSDKSQALELGRLVHVGQDGLAHDFKAAQAGDAGRRGAVDTQQGEALHTLPAMQSRRGRSPRRHRPG